MNVNQEHLDLLEDLDEDTIGLLGSRFARLANRPKPGLQHKRERAGYSELLGKQHWVRPRLS
jgi:hypothetical protein